MDGRTPDHYIMLFCQGRSQHNHSETAFGVYVFCHNGYLAIFSATGLPHTFLWLGRYIRRGPAFIWWLQFALCSQHGSARCVSANKDHPRQRYTCIPRLSRAPAQQSGERTDKHTDGQTYKHNERRRSTPRDHNENSTARQRNHAPIIAAGVNNWVTWMTSAPNPHPARHVLPARFQIKIQRALDRAHTAARMSLPASSRCANPDSPKFNRLLIWSIIYTYSPNFHDNSTTTIQQFANDNSKQANGGKTVPCQRWR